ncbi:M16 family metallopeptidase [Telluria aromaticivorans]|uniref:Insulinase family protein n=1 Tax=Telluria aromaticivorans TaxID=2725995 RepID=A0A7Y2K2A0_9BURK|nr:pitrilysin family protein [Telluria aromaticivorans]NNG24775.1 insulinase family protein [Telluria aromaticivorans]
MAVSVRNLKLAAALALATSISAAHAAPAKQATMPDIPIPNVPYTKFVLKNGLTVLVHEDHKTPVVAVNTWYHVGSKNEKVGKTGFAHLFEHLMFSGSDNFKKTYLNAMEGIGATDLNGTTNQDRTNYFQNVPTSMLDYALFAESDRMGHLLGTVDKKKLDLQRGVVQNEKRQRENQPYGVAYELLVNNTYPVGHPYSWTVIGKMEDLDAASMTDVQDWFKTNYGPNNTVLVLSGDITPEVARQKVEQYYGHIPPGPPLAKHEAWIAKRTGSHRTTVQDRVPQSRIYRTWNVPGAHTPEEAQLDLAALVLGGGKTSRLYKRLVYKDQLATSATASDDAAEIGGQFDLTLTARPGADVAKMERVADEELRALMKNGPTDAELRLAKTTILAQYTRMIERVGGFGGKSDLLASCTTYTGNPDCYKVYLERIKAATPASVKKAMNDWLSDGDFVLQVDPYPTTLVAGAAADRSKEPALGKPMSLKLPDMQKMTLSNGLKVVLAERHDAPVVNFQLLVDSGYASDAFDKPGVASLALRMLEEGTKTRKSLEIGEEFAGLGAQFGAGTNLDSAFVTMNTLKATLPQSLAVYSDLVLNPAFPQNEFTRLQKDRLAAIQREKTVPQLMALRVLPNLLYGKDHVYARPFTGTGTEEAVKRMTRDDLANYHATWFKPNNATLLVVGDTTLAEIKPLLEKSFAGWKAGEVPKKVLANVAPKEKSVVYLVDRPGALQSVIVGAQLAPPRNSPEALPLEIVNDVFGGTFSSRINMNLREDKHWSYGVSSQLSPAIGQRPFMSVSPVQTDKTREAMQELVSEYRNIAGGKPITAEELKGALDNNTLGLPGSFETAGQLTNAYTNIVQYGLGDDYYNTFTEKALSLTPQQANALAARSFTPDRLVWVVVGDLSKIESGIRALNIGEVRKIDVDGNPVK